MRGGRRGRARRRSTPSSSGRSRRRSRGGALPGPFDTICCYDVLEHLVDPRAVLRQLRALADAGRAAARLDPQRAPLLARLRPRAARDVRLHRVRPPRRDAPALVHAPRPRRARRATRAGTCGGSRATCPAGATRAVDRLTRGRAARVHRAAVAPARARGVTWAVCVLNWNGREDTLRCLASLRAATRVGRGRQRLDRRQRRGDPRARSRTSSSSRTARTSASAAATTRRSGAALDARRRVGRAAQQRRRGSSRARSTRCAAAAARHPRAGVLAGKLLYPGRARAVGGPARGAAHRLLRPPARLRAARRLRRTPSRGRTDRAVGALMAVSRDGDRRARGCSTRTCSPTSRTSTGRCASARRASSACSSRRRAPCTRCRPRPAARSVDAHRLLRRPQHDRRVRAPPAAGRASAPRRGARACWRRSSPAPRSCCARGGGARGARATDALAGGAG